MPKASVSLSKRILRDVEFDTNGGCWLWSRHVQPNGYAQMARGIGERGKSVYAHRAAYECFVGPIPNGLQIDHLCRVRCCVNPAHLEAVTPRVNTRRSNSVSGLAARRTHCIHGHPFDEANTKFRYGGRICRTCLSLKQWRAREARKANRDAR